MEYGEFKNPERWFKCFLTSVPECTPVRASTHEGLRQRYIGYTQVFNHLPEMWAITLARAVWRFDNNLPSILQHNIMLSVLYCVIFVVSIVCEFKDGLLAYLLFIFHCRWRTKCYSNPLDLGGPVWIATHSSILYNDILIVMPVFGDHDFQCCAIRVHVLYLIFA